MKIKHWLGALWVAMILSMLLKWKIDTYMVVSLIILPILVVLIDLQDEVTTLKEEAKHQRKFTMDRFTILSDKLKDLSSQMEKKVVVDFAEFARHSPPDRPLRRAKLKKRREAEPTPTANPTVDLGAAAPPEPAGKPAEPDEKNQLKA